jgi:hypothetical protein
MWSAQFWVTLQAGLGVAVVLVAGYVGYYVVKYLRGATSKDDTDAGDLTSNFEEMRREGDISEAEFRTIQSVIGKTQSSGPSSDPRTKTCEAD